MQVNGTVCRRRLCAGVIAPPIFAVLVAAALSASAQVPPPTAPIGISPSGGVTETNRRSELVWTPSSTATWYRVWINRFTNTYYSKWLEQAGGTWTADIDLKGGSYTWWVRGWCESAGYSAWSAPCSFVVQTMVPARPVPESPSGELTDSRPAFRWPAVEHATWYYLWINRDGKKYSAQWYFGATNYTPTADLPFGKYKWWVRAWSIDGYSAWSAPLEFTLGLSTPSAPVESTTGSVSRFTWTAVPSATWYQVWLNRNGQFYYKQWVEGATNLALSGALPAGDYRWWVRGWGPGSGTGPWSLPARFMVAVPGTYEYRSVAFKTMYGKTEDWFRWMVTNKVRYQAAFAASASLPGTVVVSFRYETAPIAYDPPWLDEAEHMSVFRAMAAGAYPGYNFSFVYNGNTNTSYANIIAGISENLSYAWGKNLYLYYETIFNHEFGHTMKLNHHYDTMAEMGNGCHMPPGDSAGCIMDRTSSLFCSACRTALGLPLDVSDPAAVDVPMADILDRYP